MVGSLPISPAASVPAFCAARSRSCVPSEATRSTNTFSGLVRADYLLSATHTLTLRGNLNGNTSEPSRLGPLALPFEPIETRSR